MYMNKIEVWKEVYCLPKDNYNMKKKGEENIVNYMNRFEKAAHFAKKHKMYLPPKVKGLKQLHDAGLSDQDVKLVLTGVNFK